MRSICPLTKKLFNLINTFSLDVNLMNFKFFTKKTHTALKNSNFFDTPFFNNPLLFINI